MSGAFGTTVVMIMLPAAASGHHLQLLWPLLLQVGFGVAVEYCIQQDLQACWQRTQQLAARLRQRLSAEVPGLTVQDRGRVLCGIVSFTLASHPDPAEVKSWLAAQQPPINVSRGWTKPLCSLTAYSLTY